MTDEVRTPKVEYLSVVLLILGVTLIAISFAPFSPLSQRAWTVQDSQAFGNITRELHQSTVELPAESGRTAEERALYRQNLEQEFERLNNKLEQAQAEPQRWSRILWWTGAVLAAVGGLMHTVRQFA